MPVVIGLEIEHGHGSPSDFIAEVAQSIREGNGAGNCTPYSIAFWTMGYLPEPQPDWSLTTITLIDSEDLTDSDIASAVEKVTDEPSGEIRVYGNVVGNWVTVRRGNEMG